MPTVDVRGITLHYEDEGSGFPVLLIHGLAGDSSAWRPQIDALSDRYRLVAPDNRGAGRSTQRLEALTTEDLAHDALALLETLGIEQAHVVGRSMGGAIAQHLALLAPERVRSLVLCASFAKLDPIGFRVLTNMRQVLEWRGSWEDHAYHSVANFVSPEFYNSKGDAIEDIVSLISSEQRLQGCYIAQNHACLLHDTLDALHRITCPTLVLGGSLDPICSPTATRWLADAIPGAQLVMFEGASHFFMMEQGDKFMRILSNWLAEQT